MTPPAALISLTANFTPSRMLTPIDAEPPVNGPDTPILIESAANTGAVIMLAAISHANFVFIWRSPYFFATLTIVLQRSLKIRKNIMVRLL
jgi:hypothetical protein